MSNPCAAGILSADSVWAREEGEWAAVCNFAALLRKQATRLCKACWIAPSDNNKPGKHLPYEHVAMSHSASLLYNRFENPIAPPVATAYGCFRDHPHSSFASVLLAEEKYATGFGISVSQGRSMSRWSETSTKPGR